MIFNPATPCDTYNPQDECAAIACGDATRCFHDTFTTVDPVLLQNHTPEQGSWTKTGNSDATVRVEPLAGNASVGDFLPQPGGPTRYVTSCVPGSGCVIAHIKGWFGDSARIGCFNDSGSAQAFITFGFQDGQKTHVTLTVVDNAVLADTEATGDPSKIAGIFDLTLTIDRQAQTVTVTGTIAWDFNDPGTLSPIDLSLPFLDTAPFTRFEVYDDTTPDTGASLWLDELEISVNQ